VRTVVRKNGAFDWSYASSGLCEACIVETFDLSYASSGLCEACIVETFDLSYASSGLCEACIVETIYYLHASWIYAGYTVYGLKYLTDIKCPFNASSM
jgi:hypothetical protein